MAQQGQLYGNRCYDNQVNNANPHWFSYPGYNEILTGYPDTAVNSNDKILNKHETVLEFLKLYSPKVLYIAFDETDDWAHGGKYDNYLEAALFTDKWTTDHGRGDLNKRQWRDHGDKIEDAYQIWFAALPLRPIIPLRNPLPMF